MKTNAQAVRLITIPLSHYCEKARWGLDRVGLRYTEEPHAPLLSRLAGGTVPVLVHGKDRFIDSTDILVHADAFCDGDLLYPRDAELRREVDSLEERFDTELGIHTRRWAYAHLLPDSKLLRSVWSRRVPRLEASLVPVIAPMARYLARTAYRINRKPRSARSSACELSLPKWMRSWQTGAGFWSANDSQPRTLHSPRSRHRPFSRPNAAPCTPSSMPFPPRCMTGF